MSTRDSRGTRSRSSHQASRIGWLIGARAQQVVPRVLRAREPANHFEPGERGLAVERGEPAVHGGKQQDAA
jgi:hypothetical protein